MLKPRVRRATEADSGTVLALIRGLAEYENLLHAVVATEDDIRRTLFGERPAAEVFLAFLPDQSGRGASGEEKCAGFALFFSTYSTFLARPGIYLEDLFVWPEFRGRGVGISLLQAIAVLAEERDCGRVEWSVLDWNQPSILFYRQLGAVPMDEWTGYRLTGEALRNLAARGRA